MSLTVIFSIRTNKKRNKKLIVSARERWHSNRQLSRWDYNVLNSYAFILTVIWSTLLSLDSESILNLTCKGRGEQCPHWSLSAFSLYKHVLSDRWPKFNLPIRMILYRWLSLASGILRGKTKLQINKKFRPYCESMRRFVEMMSLMGKMIEFDSHCFSYSRIPVHTGTHIHCVIWRKRWTENKQD